MVNLPIEYSDKQVTPFGGMSLMKRFIDQTGSGVLYRRTTELFRIKITRLHHGSSVLSGVLKSGLKSYCFALGAWTVSHSNKKVLEISLPNKRRPWMEGIFSQIKNLSPPFDYSNA